MCVCVSILQLLFYPHINWILCLKEVRDSCHVFFPIQPCLWWYILISGSLLALLAEPAAFSVKTTPQTRNQKVTKPLWPAMSLTRQVTSIPPARLTALRSHSVPATYSYTFFPRRSCLTSLCAPTTRDSLAPFLSVPLTHFWPLFFIFLLFSHNSVSLCSVWRMCERRPTEGARHGATENFFHWITLSFETIHN